MIVPANEEPKAFYRNWKIRYTRTCETSPLALEVDIPVLQLFVTRSRVRQLHMEIELTDAYESAGGCCIPPGGPLTQLCAWLLGDGFKNSGLKHLEHGGQIILSTQGVLPAVAAEYPSLGAFECACVICAHEFAHMQQWRRNPEEFWKKSNTPTLEKGATMLEERWLKALASGSIKPFITKASI